MKHVRNLIIILGDQLDPEGPALEGADASQDIVVMAEVAAEVERYPNHKQRVVLFLSAMRHFRDALEARGFKVVYRDIATKNPAPSRHVTAA